MPPSQRPHHFLDRLGRFGWLAVAALLLFCALAPVTLEAQVILSGTLLVALLLTYAASRIDLNLRNQALVRLMVIAISGFLVVRYIHWRATETLPLQFGLASSVCGLLLFLAEIHGFVNMVLGFFINSAPFVRRSVPLPADAGSWPHVDVYIPTYNEDPLIVKATLIAATQMDYPRDKLHVYVLDDGGTAQKLGDRDPVKAQAAAARAQELKALAARFGGGYVTRDRNVHAKAGNINSALQHTSGALLTILDCDHIPTEDFLRRTVGFFLADPRLFVLQTPHNFTSADPIERNLETYKHSPSENELFYDVMQPGLDFWGASFFCGSAAILRRAVIDQLGGVSGKTITEDAETTLDALSLGYTSAYYNRPMVSGLQPETVSGFIVQRVRWAQGMWQIFLLKNPWKQPKLTVTQRLLFTNFSFYWGFAFSRMVMLLAPPAYLILGINLCDTSAQELLAFSAPALVASLLSAQFFYGRVRWPLMSQLYEITQAPFVARGLLEVIRRPSTPSFKVTPKGETLSEGFTSSLSRPFYVLLAVSSLAVAFGFYRYMTQPMQRGVIGFVMFWAVLDVLLLLGTLGITFERRQLRSEPRAVSDTRLRIRFGDQWLDGTARDASVSGLGLLLDAPANSVPLLPRLDQTVDIEFPEFGGRLTGTVKAVIPGAQTSLGLQYRLESIADERLAVRVAFGSSDRLVANNERRHGSKGVAGSLLLLVQFALWYGVQHLGHRITRLRPEQRRPASAPAMESPTEQP